MGIKEIVRVKMEPKMEFSMRTVCIFVQHCYMYNSSGNVKVPQAQAFQVRSKEYFGARK